MEISSRTHPCTSNENGEQLEIQLTVDDPGTFYLPWKVMRRLERSDEPLEEKICREGNFGIIDWGVPIDETPDFWPAPIGPASAFQMSA